MLHGTHRTHQNKTCIPMSVKGESRPPVHLSLLLWNKKLGTFSVNALVDMSARDTFFL